MLLSRKSLKEAISCLLYTRSKRVRSAGKIPYSILLVYVFIFQVFNFQAAFAQMPSEPRLQDYIQYAQEQNPGIQAAFNEWKAAVEKIAVVRGLPNPALSLGFFLENVETAVGPQEYKLGLTQMFPWFGKLSTQGKVQSAQAEIMFHRLQQKRLILESRTELVYYDFYYLLKAIEITRQNIELVQNWEWVVQSKYKTAISSHLDVIKTQIELINLEDDLKSLNAKKRPLLKKFQEILNDTTIQTVFIADSLEFLTMDLGKTELLKFALENNPGLLAAGSQITRQTQVLKRARLEYFPDFGLGVERIGTGTREMDGAPVLDSGKDPLVFKVSLNLPIWLKKNAKTVRTAKYKQNAAQFFRQNEENRLLSDIENVWYDLTEAERKFQLYQQVLIPKSLESLGASEKAYVSDKVDFLTLVDAQRRYLQFALNYEKTLVDYLKSRSKLELLIGKPLGS